MSYVRMVIATSTGVISCCFVFDVCLRFILVLLTLFFCSNSFVFKQSTKFYQRRARYAPFVCYFVIIFA